MRVHACITDATDPKNGQPKNATPYFLRLLERIRCSQLGVFLDIVASSFHDDVALGSMVKLSRRSLGKERLEMLVVE